MENEIENNRKMAEIMGWTDTGEWWGKDWKTAFNWIPVIRLEDWHPEFNLVQALSVADMLCKKNGWARQSKYRPSGGYYKFYFFDDITYPTETHHECTADTEVEAVYKALCAAIEKGEGE